MFILCLLLLFEIMTFSFSCPLACSCKWKNGKQTVECRHKGLLAVPRGVHSGTQVIDLTHNSLDHLPADAFSDVNLLNLQKIYLRACHLRQVDSRAFSHLSNLIEIDLSENRLKEIPSESFKPAFELRELNLRRNPLKRVRSGDFLFTPSLTRLDLSYCLITSIAYDAFVPLENLLHLKIQGNELTLLHPQVITSLRSLHGVEIHENPWSCDCRARPFRKWSENVPHSQSPTCETPHRLRGRFIDALPLNDFACPPQTLPTKQILESSIGGNSTLWCPVTGIPPPTISWLSDGHLILNGSVLTKSGARALIIEINGEEHGSVLVVVGQPKGIFDKNMYKENIGHENDSQLKIRCIASNPAGAVSISFTLNFYHPTIFGMFSDETMKIIVLLLAVSILCLLIATIFVALFRRRSNIPSPPMSDQYDGYSGDQYDTAYADGSLITNEEPPSVTAKKYTFDPETTKPNEEKIIWAPERALAVLDSAAPEHVMHSSYDKELPPACRALLAPRHSSSSGSMYSSQKRLSYLPDFAPTFLESYQFEHVTSNGRDSSHCQTLPRTLRVKTFSTTEGTFAASTLPHNLWTSSCRRYSQPLHAEVTAIDEAYLKESLEHTHKFMEEDH